MAMLCADFGNWSWQTRPMKAEQDYHTLLIQFYIFLKQTAERAYIVGNYCRHLTTNLCEFGALLMLFRAVL